MEELFPLLFGILFFSVFIWFYMCHKMFSILRTRHPEKYQTMGKPSLIMNNTFTNNLSFMKFLFKSEWQDLNDGGLASLGKGMLALFVIYTVLFFSLLFSVPLCLAP